MLPIHKIGGVYCTAVSPRQTWLHHLLGGHACCHEYIGAIHNFLEECRRAAQTPALSQADATPHAPASSQALPYTDGIGRGRSAIFGDGSDSPDDDTNPTKPAPKAAAQKMRRGDIVAVTVHGMEISIHSVGSKRIVVHANQDNLAMLVSHLAKRKGEARWLGADAGLGATTSAQHDDATGSPADDEHRGAGSGAA